MKSEIQILKAENQNLRILLQDKKRKINIGKLILVLNQSLNFKICFNRKKLEPNPQKIKEEVQLQIKKTNLKQIRQKSSKKCKHDKTLLKTYNKTLYCCQKTGYLWRQCLQQTRMPQQHGKQFGTSRRLYCNCFGGIYRETLIEVDSNVTLLIQDLDNQQKQSKQHQNDNEDLGIYLEKLEKNYKKMEEQFYELIEEKEQLSQFEINSDENMYS